MVSRVGLIWRNLLSSAWAQRCLRRTFVRGFIVVWLFFVRHIGIGACIASFGLNCLLAGRSLWCMQGTWHIKFNQWYIMMWDTIADIVSNKCISTVFFGHNQLTRQKPWQRTHGQMVSRVGMIRWNLRSLFLAKTCISRTTRSDCHSLATSPSCCSPEVHVEKALRCTRLQTLFNHSCRRFACMRLSAND